MINLPQEGIHHALFPYLGLPTAHTNKQTWRAGSQANPYNHRKSLRQSLSTKYSFEG